ncbi:MAG: hypothetical protein KGJ75_11685 [Alphaproteobacteria bacterium]|nr:hypothetical protein [Alphaproteobacteria bacterium]
MNLQTETLIAYVDGELTPEEVRRVETEISARPELKAFVEEQAALRRAIPRAFDAILDAPVPGRLLAAAARPPSRRWRLMQDLKDLATWRALIWTGVPAAALACGVVIGVLVTAPQSADIVFVHGNLVAHGALSAALTHRLSGKTLRTASAEIGVSFRDQSGRYCRTFATGGAAPMAGVACHQDGAWHIAALAEPGKEEDTGAAYALSGSTMPAAVRSAVRSMMAGIPLDVAGEKKARDDGWVIRRSLQ